MELKVPPTKSVLPACASALTFAVGPGLKVASNAGSTVPFARMCARSRRARPPTCVNEPAMYHPPDPSATLVVTTPAPPVTSGQPATSFAVAADSATHGPVLGPMWAK